MPVPKNEAIHVRRNGETRKMRPAFGVKLWEFQRELSRERGLMLIMDVEEYEGSEDLFGYFYPYSHARQLATAIIAMCDELEGADEAEQ